MPETTENTTTDETVDPVIEAAEVKSPPAATAAQVEDVNRILKEVNEKLPTPEKPGPTKDQIREMIRTKTGLSDEGINWVMDFNRNTVTEAMAPIQQKLAFGDLKTSKASSPFPVTDEIEKGIKEELKGYPVSAHGDSVLLEKIYWIEVGKAAARGAKPSSPKTETTTPVVGRRIVSDNPNPAGNNGNAAKSSGTKLTDEEKSIAKKMGVPEAEYEKYKGSPAISR